MGCGFIATHGHAPAILETPGLLLAAVYDPDPDQIARFKERYPYAEGYTDADEFFSSRIDAVSITSPAPRHLENVSMAARYRKPVLCEKPLAMTEDDIEQMIAVMDDAGLPFATALCYRFSPVAQRIRQMVAEGVIGELRALRLIYIWNLHGKYDVAPDGRLYESPRRVGRMIEGGPMVDCGVHQIDLARWWSGAEIVRQQSAAAWVEQQYEAPDHVWLHLDHANGVHSAVEISFAYCHTVPEPINHFSYHLIGSDGLIRYDREGWLFEVRNSRGVWTFPGADEKNFAGMYAAWHRALETGDMGDMPTARDGLIVTRIARGATEAAIAQRRGLAMAVSAR
jgi:predicted dehydrogenase